MGFTIKHVAKKVKRLYCCDISASFLDIARKFGFRLVSKGRLLGLYQGAAVDLIFRKR
jgi:hypothetical protein